MAVSKTQNERPAIIELVDAVNAMGDVNERFDTLTRSLSATNAQVLALTEEVDDFSGDLAETNTNVDALDRAMDAVDEFMARIRIGETETITVPANDSYASSYVFDVPFTADARCMVILQVLTDELSTLFDVSLIDCTYSGFSYQITNSDADAHDVKLGYVAFKTNGN